MQCIQFDVRGSKFEYPGFSGILVLCLGGWFLMMMMMTTRNTAVASAHIKILTNLHGYLDLERCPRNQWFHKAELAVQKSVNY